MLYKLTSNRNFLLLYKYRLDIGWDSPLGQGNGYRLFGRMSVHMALWNKKRDVLREKYGSEDALKQAKELLVKDEQSEEGFLGAQAILMLQGLI